MGTLMFGVYGTRYSLIVDLTWVAKIMGVETATLMEHAKEHDEWDSRKRIKNRRPYLVGGTWVIFDWVYAIVLCVSPASKKLTMDKRKEVCERIRQELARSLFIAHLNRPLDSDMHKKP